MTSLILSSTKFNLLLLRLQFLNQPEFLCGHFLSAHMAFDAAADRVASEDPRLNGPGQAPSPYDEKDLLKVKHSEQVVTSEDNLVYDDVDEEPELHARTYIAFASMFVLNLVQVLALQGPPAVVGDDCAASPGGPD